MDQEIKQAGFEIRNRILRKKTEFVKFGRYIMCVIKKIMDYFPDFLIVFNHLFSIKCLIYEHIVVK